MTTPRVRPATESDAAAIAALHAGHRPQSNVPPELVERIIAEDPNEVFAVNDDGTACCRISAIPDSVRRELRVSWLYPRAEFAAPGNFRLVADVLGEALRAAARKWPDKLDWRIWATFDDGRDARGNPDGGEALCKFYQANAFPTARVFERADGIWVIDALLSEAVTAVTVPVGGGGR